MRSKDNKYALNNWLICKDKLYNLQSPLIMGVINSTPDSFYKGSRTPSYTEAIQKASKMVQEGVDILDVGGVSTRPNADLQTEEEELNRVIPVIQLLKNKFPEIPISIDTFRAKVAEEAVKEGAVMVNDVYGGSYDPKMGDTIAKLKVPYILMHSRGDASNMQELCQYDDVVQDVCKELSVKIHQFREKGVKDIIIDPGFGFAKNLEQNYQLLAGLDFLKVLECPILIGISRKSLVYKLLETTPSEALNGTTILNTLAVLKNMNIIRVHDVKEAKEVKTILSNITNNYSNGF